jgi:hypothetical protein
MRKKLGVCAAFALLASVLISNLASAQAPVPIPRTSEGKPDFSGIWQTGGLNFLGPQGNVVTGPPEDPAVEGARLFVGRGNAVGRGAAPGEIATQPVLQPWAQEQVAKYTSKDDPTIHCFMPGVPRVFGIPFPFEIVQTPKQIVMLFESMRSFRQIPTDGRMPVGEILPGYNGQSAGRWEGDTLVVDVKNFNGRIWGPLNMRMTSDALHVVERYTHQGNTIAYEALVEDPKVLTEPFVYRLTFRKPPETQVMEFECLENNINLEHIVR